MRRLGLVVICILVSGLIALGLLTGWMVAKLAATPAKPAAINTAAIIRQVQGLSQLVTVKYVIEKVVIFEDVKWYGENRVLMVAHGIAKAGVDLGQIKLEDVRVAEKKITISLPKESITDVYLDDKQTQVIERTTGVLRTFDKDLEQNARREAVDAIRRAARQGGILKDARERAEVQLREFLRPFGFEQIEIQTK